MRRLAGLVLAAGVAAACGGYPSESQPDTEVDLRAEPGEAFTLAPGEAAEVAGAALLLRLVEVANDSRCPADVTCVWAGDAVAAIEVVHDGVEHAIGLHLNPGQATGPGGVDIGGYRIELVAVAPEARSDVAIAGTDYRVTFRVGRIG